MKRASLYSSSRRPRGARAGAPISSDRTAASGNVGVAESGGTGNIDPPRVESPSRTAADRAAASLPAASAEGAAEEAGASAGAAAGASAKSRWYGRPARYAAPVAAAICGALLVLALQGELGNQRQLTQEDIDKAVLNTLETQQLPSAPARAARIIGPSVVRVQAFGPEEADPKAAGDIEAQKGRARPVPKDASKEPRKDPQNKDPQIKDPQNKDPQIKDPQNKDPQNKDPQNKDPQKSAKDEPREDPKEPPKEVQKGVGTGVVIKDSGLILTNLHVVSGAQRISVVFADGTESEVNVTGARPEHDLAVLQAVTLPDDLQPATLRSTGDLQEGDGVVAVGFPFDIGPSVSAGVISGFGREYRSTSGERILTNLIQFDAAANPGSSGGPLVTMDGEVVGIVTAILNPNNQRSFVGIGFAVPIENAAAAVGIPPH